MGTNPEKAEDQQLLKDRLNFRLGRRSILKSLGIGAGLMGVGFPTASNIASGFRFPDPERRADAMYNFREQAADEQLYKRGFRTGDNNRDEERYPDGRANYIKALPLRGDVPAENQPLGIPESDAYEDYLTILKSGEYELFGELPTGGGRRYLAPQSTFKLELVGIDPHQMEMKPAPRFSSDEMGAEMAEVYWHALLRDIPFREYGDPVNRPHGVAPVDAAEDLSSYSDFRGPKENGKVTLDTLFRSNIEGSLIGPYISQFLWMNVPMGAMNLEQNVRTSTQEFGTDYSEWYQRVEGTIGKGVEPGSSEGERPNQIDETVFICNGQNLAAYVQIDFSYQAYLNAALIIFERLQADDRGDVFDSSIPHIGSETQLPYITFGGVSILDLVAHAASHALSAAWYQKWGVHRRLRPEEFGGRVHNEKQRDDVDYEISRELIDSPVLNAVQRRNNDEDGNDTYLLPLAYREGSPAHPSYPSGHATIAGACVTILKAFFNEEFQIQNPVQATADGTELERYVGDTLSVGNELDKLASNIAIARNFAGVHYRSDAREGLYLGEQVGIDLLEYIAERSNETPPELTFVDFDGNQQTIRPLTSVFD